MALSTTSPPLGPNSGTAHRIPFHSRLAKVWSILYIVYSIEVGGFLLILPWLTIWDDNYLMLLYPQMRPIVGNPFLKGAVLGLGVVNIVIGIQECAYLWKHSGARQTS